MRVSYVSLILQERNEKFYVLSPANYKFITLLVITRVFALCEFPVSGLGSWSITFVWPRFAVGAFAYVLNRLKVVVWIKDVVVTKQKKKSNLWMARSAKDFLRM